METEILIKELKDLVQVNIDASHAYNRVLDEISDGIVRERLASFRDDHVDHISDLSHEIHSLGGESPRPTKDFKGYVIEAFAAIRKATGMEGALKALEAVEKITTDRYRKIFPKVESPELKKMLREQFSEENLHLEYIENNLKSFK